MFNPVTITPLAMSSDAFARTGGYYDGVLPLDQYEKRQSVERDLPEEGSAKNVLESVWSQFQNVSEDWLTPDGGRSLMVGDLMQVERPGYEDELFRVSTFGFKKVDFPAVAAA